MRLDRAHAEEELARRSRRSCARARSGAGSRARGRRARRSSRSARPRAWRRAPAAGRSARRGEANRVDELLVGGLLEHVAEHARSASPRGRRPGSLSIVRTTIRGLGRGLAQLGHRAQMLGPPGMLQVEDQHVGLVAARRSGPPRRCRPPRRPPRGRPRRRAAGAGRCGPPHGRRRARSVIDSPIPRQA